ncbi:WYL domain-containing protein [Pantoea sp. LS15]|uniref:helix-turn-helix transcriptional regulator n=1 Tax=Enterobacterales TaxID=91347 RepID=UPI000E0FF352|nr:MULTISPECIES: WYL domain-containing protein [Enterobacterales]NJQ21003.1 WYL domain-containing protein [Pantoea sp. LS15]NKF47599.1 WYL domain-containing protein [Pantoea sp. LS15]RDK13705.1 WYL domain-containing protein [Enterobacter sp. 9-2]
MAKTTRSRSAERLVDILVELHLNGVVNRSALMEKFKITERTVYRDLNALSPIVEHTGNGLYRLIHSSQSPGGQGLHHSLANFLNADSFFPERNAEFWQKLETRVDENHILILGNEAEHTVQRDIRLHLAKIEKSIKNHNVCQIVYKSKTRLINPYKLINKKNIWYLQATENGRLKSFSLSQISWLDIHTTTFTPEENARELLEKSLDPWVSEDTFAVKIFIKNNISHYFLRRDLLPKQELLEEQHSGVTLRCQAAHENQILPLLFYWLPDIQILEPSWLKEKLIRTLESYLAIESSAHNQVISIT